MNKSDSVRYAMHSMELEGFIFTEEDKIMWEKVAKGELSTEDVRKKADEFIKLTREKFPEKFIR